MVTFSIESSLQFCIQLPLSQYAPVNPEGHLQRNPLSVYPAWQVPLLKQGLLLHGFCLRKNDYVLKISMVSYYLFSKEHCLAVAMTSSCFLINWRPENRSIELLNILSGWVVVDFIFRMAPILFSHEFIDFSLFNIVQITPLVYLSFGILPCWGDS